MMQRYGKGFILCCLLACMNSCSDVTIKLNENIDDTACENNVLYKFDSNSKTISTRYCNTCMNNICSECEKENEIICLKDEKNNTKTIRKQCQNGEYKDIETCDNPCTTDNKCGECVNGSIEEFKPDSMKYQICINGKWVINKCSLGNYNKNNERCDNAPECGSKEDLYLTDKCPDGEWISTESKICNQDESKCEHDIEYICINNEWAKEKICDNGCNGNKCGDLPINCQENKQICDNNRIFQCIEGQSIITAVCQEHETCVDEDGNVKCKCNADATKCEKDTKYWCDNGQWIKTEQSCDKCTADRCDGNNLMVCDKTTGVAKAQTCTYGCDAATNKCNDAETPSDKCTADVCKDENTLVKCSQDGSTTEEPCANGCDAATNKCKDAQTQCTTDVCKDENTLTKCNDGVESTENCVNGCENNACRPKCEYTGNICNKDNTAALSCNNGKETSTICEKGCKDGSCMDCTEATDCGEDKVCVNGACLECNFEGTICKSDGSALISCDKGKEKVEKDCPNGCDGDKCANEDDDCGMENKCLDDKKISDACNEYTEQQCYQSCQFGSPDRCEFIKDYHTGKHCEDGKLYECTESLGCYEFEDCGERGCNAEGTDCVQPRCKNDVITIDNKTYSCSSRCENETKCKTDSVATKPLCTYDSSSKSDKVTYCKPAYGCYYELCKNVSCDTTNMSDHKCGVCLNGESRCIDGSTLEVCNNGVVETYTCAEKCEKDKEKEIDSCATIPGYEYKLNNIFCIAEEVKISSDYIDKALLGYGARLLEVNRTPYGHIVVDACTKQHEAYLASQERNGSIKTFPSLNDCNDEINKNNCPCNNVIITPNGHAKEEPWIIKECNKETNELTVRQYFYTPRILPVSDINVKFVNTPTSPSVYTFGVNTTAYDAHFAHICQHNINKPVSNTLLNYCESKIKCNQEYDSTSPAYCYIWEQSHLPLPNPNP